MPISKFSGKVGIKGGTDTTDIGNIGDQLKVRAQIVKTPSAESSRTVPLFGTLLNASGDDDMLVNGSVTPVSYTWTLPSDESWELTRLNLVLGADGDANHDEFGNRVALPNGLKFEFTINGTTYNLWRGPASTIQKNIELTSLFSDNPILGNSGSTWFKDANGRYFVGELNFFEPIILTGSTGDKVTVTVQDDLTTGLFFLNIGFDAYRTL